MNDNERELAKLLALCIVAMRKMSASAFNSNTLEAVTELEKNRELLDEHGVMRHIELIEHGYKDPALPAVQYDFIRLRHV